MYIYIYIYIYIWNGDFPSRIVSEFFFLEKLLLHTSTSTQQLPFRSSYFFSQPLFWWALLPGQSLLRSSYFLRIAISWEILLENSFSFRAVICRNSYIFGRETCSEQKSYLFEADISALQKLFQKRYFFSKGTSSNEVLFQNSYFWKKLIFQKGNIPHYVLFLESGCFFKRANFS